jgi:hypothetical protein
MIRIVSPSIAPPMANEHGRRKRGKSDRSDEKARRESKADTQWDGRRSLLCIEASGNVGPLL